MSVTAARVFLIASLAMAGAAAGEVDFTPIPSTYTVEGATFPNVTFQSGSRKITYTPPSGWKLEGAQKLTLHPPDLAQAEGSMSVEAMEAPVALDDASAEGHVKALVQKLPSESTKVEVLAVTPNPMKINGNNTLLVSIRYQLFGQTFRIQTLFMAAGRELWQFQFSAREHQFDRAYEPFRASLFSIEGLDRPTQ